MAERQEKLTIETFDPDAYADQLRDQGYKDEVIPDLVAKKKEQLESATKIEIELEELGKQSKHYEMITVHRSNKTFRRRQLVGRKETEDQIDKKEIEDQLKNLSDRKKSLISDMKTADMKEIKNIKQEINKISNQMVELYKKLGDPESTTSKPVESKSTTSKPVESKSTTSKPVESKSTTSKPVESKSTTSKPVESKSTTSKPVESKSTRIKTWKEIEVVRNKDMNENVNKMMDDFISNIENGMSMIDAVYDTVKASEMKIEYGESLYGKRYKRVVKSSMEKLNKLLSDSLKKQLNGVYFVEDDVENNRSYHKDGIIHLSGRIYDGTILHEVSHALERNPAIHKACIDFRNLRTKGERLVKLKSFLPKSGYGDDEVAKIDKFYRLYVGKVYSSTMKQTEILSMGLERFSSEKDLKKFYKEDPGHFAFVLSILSGRIIK